MKNPTVRKQTTQFKKTGNEYEDIPHQIRYNKITGYQRYANYDSKIALPHYKIIKSTGG